MLQLTNGEKNNEESVWQILCEQIRQYILGILSMDPRYLSPDEVIPSSFFHILAFDFFHSSSSKCQPSYVPFSSYSVSLVKEKCTGRSLHHHLVVLSIENFTLLAQPHLSRLGSWAGCSELEINDVWIPNQCSRCFARLFGRGRISVDGHRKCFCNVGHSKCCSWNRRPFLCSITGDNIREEQRESTIIRKGTFRINMFKLSWVLKGESWMSLAVVLDSEVRL